MPLTESIKLHLVSYIESNKALLAPPVCNTMVHNEGDLRIMVVGGPNQRKDYHINQGEEIFYQIKGDMCLKIIECGKPRDVHIKEGHFFVLPSSVPHSPQRFENTIGLVIERRRPESELDGLRYYVDDECRAPLWQRFFHVTDLGSQLKPLIQEYFASEEFKSRVPSPEMPTVPACVNIDETTKAGDAVPLSQLVASKVSAAGDSTAPLSLWDTEFKVLAVAGPKSAAMVVPPQKKETWVWALKGAGAKVNGQVLAEGETVIAPTLESMEPSKEEGAVALVVWTTGC